MASPANRSLPRLSWTGLCERMRSVFMNACKNSPSNCRPGTLRRVASMVACVTRCAPWVNRDALLGDDVLAAAAWVVGSVPTGRLASTLGGPVDFAFRAAR